MGLAPVAALFADDRARIWPRDQPGEERAFERQVSRLVIQQQTRNDAGRQGNAEREHEDEPLVPPAPLEDQHVPEPPVPHEHGGQRGHDRELDDQRGEQELGCRH